MGSIQDNKKEFNFVDSHKHFVILKCDVNPKTVSNENGSLKCNAT